MDKQEIRKLLTDAGIKASELAVEIEAIDSRLRGESSDGTNIIREAIGKLRDAFDDDSTWYVFNVEQLKRALPDYNCQLISAGIKPEAAKLIIMGIQDFLRSDAVHDRNMVKD